MLEYVSQCVLPSPPDKPLYVSLSPHAPLDEVVGEARRAVYASGTP